MIEHRCDGCGMSQETESLPKGWAAIHAKVAIGLKGGSTNEWESDNPVLLCATCSLSDGERVERLAIKALREGLKQSSHETEVK